MSKESSAAKSSVFTFAAPRSLYFLIFAASGFSGLIYESIWSHYLKLFLGHAAYAQSLVLIIFMGGMALGSWLASRFSERWKSLLLMYAGVELIVGIAALAFHGLFSSLIDVFYSAVLPSVGTPIAGATLKWLAASLLITPQSILLGMTFPLMSAGIIRRFPGTPGGSIAMLYFTNSLGAAIGVLVSGFWLIDAVGLPGTIISAGLINIVLAGTVWALVRLDPQAETTPIRAEETGDGTSALTRLFVVAAFITGAASFIYEVGWIRMLSFVLSSTTHSFELMLSAFITGLAFGGLWIRKRIDKIASPVRFAGFVQLIMGVLAILTIPIYIESFDWMASLMQSVEKTDSGYAKFSLASHAIALAIMLPTTFMAGMTLPLFTYVLLKRGGGEASIGRIYAANTVGAIAGVLFAVHVGFPRLGLKNLIVLGAMLDVGLGLVLLSRMSGDRRRSLQYGVAVAVVALALAFGVTNLDPRLLASGVYRLGDVHILSNTEVLYYEDGKTASIALIKFTDGTVSVYTNGKSDAAIQTEHGKPYKADQTTMTLTGALGLAYKPDATKVAVIGMGSGLTTHTLLSKSDVDVVDTIEIEPAIVEASEGFGELVQRAYEDPRSNIIIEDAKTFFSLHNSVYDVIVAEPSNPWVSGVASLFSTEFYHTVGNYLEDDGVFVQWIQLYEFSDELAVSILKALSANFSDYEIYAVDDGNILLIAKKNGQMGEPHWPALFDSGVKAELEKVDVRTMADLQIRKVADRNTLEPFLKIQQVPTNSDYYPFVDLNAGRARFAGASANIFASWMRAPLPVLEMLYDERPQFHALVRGGYLGRVAQVATADWLYSRIVDGVSEETLAERGSRMPEHLTSLATWLTMAADDCGDDLDIDRWVTYVQYLMANSLPFMSPYHGANLIDAVDRSECGPQQRRLIAGWFDLYRAVARRDAAQMASIGRELLQIMPAQAPAAHRSYLLDAAVLGEIASGRVREALAICQQYVPAIYGDSPLPGHMQLLCGFAVGISVEG
jgi:predicted membrane-bound spermidine synthase